MIYPIWSYPMKGVYYFFRNGHRLWPRVARFVGEVLASSVAILISIVYFTFAAQRRIVSSVFPNWFGTAGAILLVILETAVLVVLIFQNRLESAQRKLFLDVLQLRNVTVSAATEDEHSWIQERLIPRLVNLPPESNYSTVRRKPALANLNELITEDKHPLLHYFLTLPLNFIPVVGSVLFCWVNAFSNGIGLHHHYYSAMKKLSAEEEAAVVHAKKSQYQNFGFVSSALSLIPGLDIVLVLTNAVGAALWAADMEKTQGSIKTKY